MQGLQGPLVVEQPFSLQLKLKRRGDMPMRSVAIQAGELPDLSCHVCHMKGLQLWPEQVVV